jgi:hypothetical protein
MDGHVTEPKIVVGVDPGGTTGIAWWVKATDAVDVTQVGPCKDNDKLHDVLVVLNQIVALAEPLATPGCVHIMLERFEFRMDERDRTKIDYMPAEVVGAIRSWAHGRTSVKLVLTGASLGKGFWTDDKIKKLALWVPGLRHAMDALRHLLRYRLFHLRHQELLESFRPEEGPAGIVSAATLSKLRRVTERI